MEATLKERNYLLSFLSTMHDADTTALRYDRGRYCQK